MTPQYSLKMAETPKHKDVNYISKLFSMLPNWVHSTVTGEGFSSEDLAVKLYGLIYQLAYEIELIKTSLTIAKRTLSISEQNAFHYSIYTLLSENTNITWECSTHYYFLYYTRNLLRIFEKILCGSRGISMRVDGVAQLRLFYNSLPDKEKVIFISMGLP